MELKSFQHQKSQVQRTCFNRTFMELKCDYGKRDGGCKVRFNRTFMELKWSHGSSRPTRSTVLIVPLWN